MRQALMLLAPIALVAVPAAAQERETVRATVSLVDLNLASAKGQRVAAQRVRHATALICGTAADTRDLAQIANIRRCRSEAMTSGTAATARAIAAAGAAPQVALR